MKTIIYVTGFLTLCLIGLFINAVYIFGGIKPPKPTHTLKIIYGKSVTVINPDNYDEIRLSDYIKTDAICDTCNLTINMWADDTVRMPLRIGDTLTIISSDTKDPLKGVTDFDTTWPVSGNKDIYILAPHRIHDTIVEAGVVKSKRTKEKITNKYWTGTHWTGNVDALQYIKIDTININELTLETDYQTITIDTAALEKDEWIRPHKGSGTTLHIVSTKPIKCDSCPITTFGKLQLPAKH